MMSATLIAQAAAIIATYNQKLSTMWINQPFKRVDIAHAFSAGFTSEDVTKPASLVMQVAYIDRDCRKHLKETR